jgi:hypothetical protein
MTRTHKPQRMPIVRPWFWRTLLLCCLAWPVLGPWANADALWEEDRQRLNVGLKLFPACLAADQGLHKRADEQGRLLVLVLHPDSRRRAEDVAADLRGMGAVKEMPLRVEAVTWEGLAAYRGQPLAAIFVAAPAVPEHLYEQWLQEYRTLVFSPFAGAVEQGAVAGIQITDRILPYVNLRQAVRAGIDFKPFFLRIAARHE